VKIIVCVKAVPGYITGPKVSDKPDNIDYTAGSIIINESDDYALEKAVALKKKTGGEVTVLTMGSLSSQKVLQAAFAKDADKAVRVDLESMDPKKTAELLGKAIKDMEYDLILTGVEARDTMGSQVGLRIAEILNIPFAYAVTEVIPGEEDKTIQMIKEVGAGLKQKEVLNMPALLCVQTGNTPTSFVPFKKMMMAQRKPVKTLKPSDLGMNEMPDSGVRIVEVFLPSDSAQAEIISGSPKEIASVVMSKIKEVA
jgi:electron transfer flavoprotein beta subunit